MATAYVTFGSISRDGVFDGAGARSTTVTTSAASAATGITAGTGEYAQIFCATPVYARAAGTVTTTNGVFCPGNIATYIKAAGGVAVALIDA